MEGNECLMGKVKPLLQFCEPIDEGDSLKKFKPDHLTIVDNALDESQWLFSSSSMVKLTVSDKIIIANGQQLHDNHINFAQGILKDTFMNTESTILQLHHKLECFKGCSTNFTCTHKSFGGTVKPSIQGLWKTLRL